MTCPDQSIRHSLAENAPLNVADIFNFDPPFMSQDEHKAILGHPNGQLDDHEGFDNLLDVNFFNGFGILDHDYNQVFHEILDPCNKKLSSCMDPCSKKISSCMDLGNKKLSHNAHERNRRKKQNALYAQLQDVLPNPNRIRKLSIAKTVCRALKYIPELQIEIEKLRRKRDKLLIIRRVSETGMVACKSHFHSHDGFVCFPPNVTVNSAASKYSELLMTIYTCRDAVLESLLFLLIEKEGLEIMDSSTFVSPHTICRILRLKMIRSTVDMEALQKKILFLFENGAGIGFFKPRLTKCRQM